LGDRVISLSEADHEYYKNHFIIMNPERSTSSQVAISVCSSFMLLGWLSTALPISHAGENVVIVLDDSGSMNERMQGGVRRMEAAKTAIASVLKQFPADTKLGLLLLNGDPGNQHWSISLAPLSVPQATNKVMSIQANGGTPLGDRIRDGADALLKLRESQIYGSYRLLIVTDGEANDAGLLATYLPDVLSRGLTVDAIGVDMKNNHSLATRVHSYRRGDDSQALAKAVEEVFAESSDSNSDSGKEDFALLEGLDDAIAKEMLQSLSKPNNAPIAGLTVPDNWNSPNGAGGIAGGGIAGVGGGGILATILGTMAMCMVPLLLVLIVFAAIVSKASKRSGGRR